MRAINILAMQPVVGSSVSNEPAQGMANLELRWVGPRPSPGWAQPTPFAAESPSADRGSGGQDDVLPCFAR